MEKESKKDPHTRLADAWLTLKLQFIWPIGLAFYTIAKVMDRQDYAVPMAALMISGLIMIAQLCLLEGLEVLLRRMDEIAAKIDEKSPTLPPTV